MIKISVDAEKFIKEVENVLEYSIGFFEGIEKGKNRLLNNIAAGGVEAMKAFIDSNARVDPGALHHIYEWNQIGSPSARLFDITYKVSNGGISFNSTLSQSSSIKDGSKTPFYDKARIMEFGIPVTITPTRSEVLVFEKDGETIFTRKPVNVSNPGGEATTGAYKEVVDSFFNNYFSQSFLRSSGILEYLKNPKAYKSNLDAGKRYGKIKGIQAGQAWVSRAGENV
jgi:hypothetical protein